MTSGAIAVILLRFKSIQVRLVSFPISGGMDVNWLLLTLKDFKLDSCPIYEGMTVSKLLER